MGNYKIDTDSWAFVLSLNLISLHLSDLVVETPVTSDVGKQRLWGQNSFVLF